MAAGNDQPDHLPAVEPHVAAEATAEDVIAWTDGRAMVATGSPFAPVDPRRRHLHDRPEQQRLHLPGHRPGRAGRRATRVSDEMFMAAAHALAKSVDARNPGDSLLPAARRDPRRQPRHRHRRRPAGPGPGAGSRRPPPRSSTRGRRHHVGPPSTGPYVPAT